MKKVYISADMEGASGISSFHQVKANNKEFEIARRAWTQDINWLIEGAIAGGADKVLVNESHDGMNYLCPEMLHEKAEYIEGRLKSKNQMEGISSDFDVAFLLCHAKAGTNGVLSHSFIVPDIWEMRLNGEAIGEVGLNMAMASQFNVPVGLIVGDKATYEEAKTMSSNITPVITKECITQFTAHCYDRQSIREKMRSEAQKAVENSSSYEMFRPCAPYTLDVIFTIPAMVELVSYIPGMKVTGPRSVSYTCEDYLQLTKVRILIVNLARMVGDQLR